MIIKSLIQKTRYFRRGASVFALDLTPSEHKIDVLELGLIISPGAIRFEGVQVGDSRVLLDQSFFRLGAVASTC